MKFTLESIAAVSVRSVANGQFLIGEETLSGVVAISAAGVIEDWPEIAVEDLGFDALAPLLELQPELIVVGTGSRQLLPDRELMFAMARANTGFEVMDTPAAARTFNVLIGESRAVAALLYPTS